ncbi:MAG: hypothetical protein IJ033_02855 [Clostridia bacterium]|nr:hypothetical protein [Clostridia bacterium]
MKKIIMLCVTAITIVLEALPYGFVMIWTWVTPEGAGYRLQKVAYFDPIAYGYGQFTPMICAILTCILLILCIVAFFVKKNGLETTIIVFSSLAFVVSVLPLIRQAEYITALSIIIAVLLLANMVLSFIPTKKLDKK